MISGRQLQSIERASVIESLTELREFYGNPVGDSYMVSMSPEAYRRYLSFLETHPTVNPTISETNQNVNPSKTQ